MNDGGCSIKLAVTVWALDLTPIWGHVPGTGRKDAAREPGVRDRWKNQRRAVRRVRWHVTSLFHFSAVRPLPPTMSVSSSTLNLSFDSVDPFALILDFLKTLDQLVPVCVY